MNSQLHSTLVKEASIDNPTLNLMVHETPIRKLREDLFFEPKRNIGVKSILSMVNRKQSLERPTMSVTSDLMAHR